MTSISFADSRFTATPEASTPIQVSNDGKSVTIITNEGTDWWRNLERNSQDGLVYGFTVPLGETGIEIEADISLDYKVQAQLFLQIGENTWVKAGLEFDGQLFSGGVVTYPYSDWSTAPTGPKPPSKFKIALHERKLKLFIDDVMAREVNVFGDGTEKEARIGVMACSPLGGGAKAVFSDFYIKQ